MKSVVKSVLLASAIAGVGAVAFAANKASENDALASRMPKSRWRRRFR